MVSLQHWINKAGQFCCKIEAFLQDSTWSDMGRLHPIILGVGDLSYPCTSVDRADDLVAAGTCLQEAAHDMWAFPG